MTGKEVIDLGLNNIYRSWFEYRKGKHSSIDLDYFQYYLEQELFSLWEDLNGNIYKHGGYKNFMVCDNKKREISVASVRDKIVHRLVYDYLIKIYDRTFIYDAWSCRKGKGLLGAIQRTQKFIKKHSSSFVWRADIRKFFDHVDHDILLKILKFKITDKKALALLNTIIKSFHAQKGMPIGNLTSQIFSNIYLSELDRFLKHDLKCRRYLRYGDDFLVFGENKEYLENIQQKTTHFLKNKLKLKLHPQNNFIIKCRQGLKFLGTVSYPTGRGLTKRNLERIRIRLNTHNIGSYFGLAKKHCNFKKLKKFQWDLLEKNFSP